MVFLNGKKVLILTMFLVGKIEIYHLNTVAYGFGDAQIFLYGPSLQSYW